MEKESEWKGRSRPFGFRVRYDRRERKRGFFFKNFFFLCFLIRLVLRTEILTQEKRMFLLHSLDSFGKEEFLDVKKFRGFLDSKRKYNITVVFHPTLKTVGTKKNTTR